MHQFLSAIGRKCSVVNLDPANDALPYPCALDVRALVKLEDVMREEELGPNGGVMWAMEELEVNWSWLEERLVGLAGESSLRFLVEEESRVGMGAALALGSVEGWKGGRLIEEHGRGLCAFRLPGASRAVHAP